MTKVLGLDISSSSSGFSIAADGYLDIKSIGTIEPPPKLMTGAKLLFFEKAVKKLIKKHKPDVIVIEDIFKGPSVTVFKLLAMFRGVAFLITQKELKKDPISLLPTEARKLVGVGGITKEDAYAFVVKKYNFTNFKFETHNDITDSIVLSLAYFNYTGPKPKKPKKRKAKIK